MTVPPPVAMPATRARAIGAQLRVELLLTLRRGETLLVTLLIPVAVLLGFRNVIDPPDGYAGTVDFLLPGVLALAVISTGMVSLGISTAYERYYHVLKRLGGSPLSRLDLLAAKIGSVVLIEALQAAILIAIATTLLDWRPAATAPLALIPLALGTACFAGIGLLLAGTLRAEATLALANTLYLAVIGVGGLVAPLDRLPGLLEAMSRVLPAAALGEALRAPLARGVAPELADLLVLAGWTVAVLLVTVRLFRWE